MCGAKSRLLLLLLVLSSLSSFALFSCPVYAEVTLTDREAMEMLKEMEESEKDLNLARQKLTESEKDLEKLKQESKNVETTYEEQKKSYEKQLKEARKSRKTAWITAGVSNSVLTVALIVIALCALL